MPRLRMPALAALLLLAPLAAGCGDSGGGGAGDQGSVGDSTPAQLSKAAYIERADEICRRLYEQRDPLQVQAAQAAQAADADAGASVLENAADVTENRMAEIRALPAPDGDERALSAVIDSGGEVAARARNAAKAIRDDDVRALSKESARGRAATRRFNRLAIAYGFEVCGRGQSATIG